LRSPQQMWLRKALFQVHLWVGVAVAAYALVIGLTGSALVFREEMERAMWPGLYHVEPAARQMSLDQAVRRIEAERPGWRPFALRDFSQPGQATTVLMQRMNAAPTPNYRMVSFNPYTGQVLQDRLRYAGWLGLMGNLHVYLMSGQPGLIVSGAMALGLLVLCLTGLVLWWPGVARWIAALTLNPRARWKRLNWELHSVVGFWGCAALFAVTFTGVDFAFPNQVGRIVALVVEGKWSDAGSSTAARRYVVTNASLMTIDQAIEAARRALPQAAPGGYLSLPANAKSNYKVTGYYEHALPYSELVRVSLDGRTGKVLSYDDTRNEPRGSRVEQYFTTIHFGSFGGGGFLGVLVKCLWVLLGLVPALLAVTGLLMYWNRQLWPAWLKRKRARQVEAAHGR
jgi:uncharacterized iron-regulated membrane protein